MSYKPDAKFDDVADRARELRLALDEEEIDADLWLSNNREDRRPGPALMIDDLGYCLGVLNQGQPVADYYEQIQGARAALDYLEL